MAELNGHRLSLWDFDDTLARSEAVFGKMAALHPEIPGWQWRHDAHLSSLAADHTPPIVENWQRLAQIPGEHWILTGRNRLAVIRWIQKWKKDPKIGYAVRRIGKVLSTSSKIPPTQDVSLRKAAIIHSLLEDWPEVHLYDDRGLNVREAVKVDPTRVTGHLVGYGGIWSNPSARVLAVPDFSRSREVFPT